MNKYFFSTDNEYLQEKMKKESFKLSEKLLDLRYDIGLSFEETAELLNLKAEDYLDYEYGEDSIPISSYNRCIDILEDYKTRKENTTITFVYEDKLEIQSEVKEVKDDQSDSKVIITNKNANTKAKIIFAFAA